MLEIPPETQSEFSGAEEPLREPLSSLSVELSRISAEIQSINSGFQAQIQQAFVETQAAIRAELKKEFEAELERRDTTLAALHREAERVASLLGDISSELARMIDDPGVELSLVIRKKAEQANLRAYLDGLRYGINPRSAIRGED